MTERNRPHLFKYRSGAAALRSLVENSLYFAKPDQLNDRLEGKYDDAHVDAYVNEWLDAVRSLYKGAPVDMPIEARQELAENIRKQNVEVRLFSQQMGIFSTALSAGNDVMWTHYADGGEGVCFEMYFDDEVMNKHQLWPSDVIYSDAPRVLNRAVFLKDMFADLVRENPNANTEDLIELSLAENFRRLWAIKYCAHLNSIKSSQWSYENELRLLAPKFGAKNMLSDVLVGVHFLSTTGKHWGDIMAVLYEKYPGIKLVKWKFDHIRGAVGVEHEFKLVPA